MSYILKCIKYYYRDFGGILSLEFNLEDFLIKAHKANASDIHFREGKSPALRVDGKILRTAMPPLSENDFEQILLKVAKRDILEKIKISNNVDFTYEVPKFSRYRVNYCKDLGLPKLTLRVIPYNIPTLEQLNLPKYLSEFTKINNGIVLVTGPTGSGKSTTLASMVDLINKEQQKHIITIEDPVEFLYTDKKSLITQRGLGVDTESFASGIKYGLRQDPDVILVGEIRDRETLEAAIEASETGHLVISTMHTNSCIQTLNRILGFFEDNTSHLVVQRIVNTLRAIVSQKLLPKIGGGLAAAVEIMSATPAISDYLSKNQFDDIYALMQKSKSPSLVTMNASIYSLLKHGIITQDTAIDYSDNKNEIEQMIRGIYHGAKSMINNDLI